MRPNFPPKASVLAGEHDELRRQDPADPRLKAMGIQIGILVSDNRRQHLKETDRGSKGLWTSID